MWPGIRNGRSTIALEDNGGRQRRPEVAKDSELLHIRLVTSFGTLCPDPSPTEVLSSLRPAQSLNSLLESLWWTQQHFAQ